MTLDPVSEGRLQNVMPWLADKIHQMADILVLDPTPVVFRVTSGLRTWQVQDQLYAEGRSAPGNIVTNAKGGYSWHNFGVAVDLVPDDPTLAGFQCDWDSSHPAWKRMEEVGVSLGLTSGATWLRLVDAPHFQYTSPYPVNAPNDEARQIYLNEGAMAFWETIQT